jgi:ATP-dependent exoDNAse (exonuclease V) beta subunit
MSNSKTYKTSQGEAVRVSSLLDYAFPFDARVTAGWVAKAQKCTIEQVLLSWEIKRDIGTEAHFAFEHWYKTGEVIADYEKAILSIREALQSESILFSEQSLAGNIEGVLFAGTIDIVTKSRNGITIWDIKTTDKSLAEVRKKHGHCGLPELEHLGNSKLMRYTLQLNFYKLLMRRFPVTALKVILLNIETWNYEVLEISDKQAECLQLLKIYNKDKIN